VKVRTRHREREKKTERDRERWTDTEKMKQTKHIIDNSWGTGQEYQGMGHLFACYSNSI
jgi:hypothetical protein